MLYSSSGSGTTAHAVLRLNQHLKESVRFILVELSEDVALTKTRERVGKAIEGYTPLAGKKRIPVAGLGGGFSSAASRPNRCSTPTARFATT